MKIKRLRGAALPEYATSGSAAMDLRSAADGPVTLAPGGRALIPTGVAIELPSADCAAFVFARSGLAVKSGITLSNAVGVIDSDYRGEICVGLVNLSDKEYTIAPGERIAQLAVMPVIRPEIAEAAELSDTERGAGGFGSTGKK